MATTHYLWDRLENNVVGELDDSGSVVASYVTKPSLYGDVMSQRRADSGARYYHKDALGTVTELTDQTGNVTDTFRATAFGETVESTGATTSPFKFVGAKGYYVDSGLDSLAVRRRRYSPNTARWLSVDPLSPTHYIYVANSPLRLIDPSGLEERAFFDPRYWDVTEWAGFFSTMSCLALSHVIRSLLYTEYGQRAWDHYSGSQGTPGTPIEFTQPDMRQIIAQSTKVQNTLNKAMRKCVAGIEDAWFWHEELEELKVSTTLKPPWDEALGGVIIKIKAVCSCGCLFYKASIDDPWDFDFKWFQAHRSLSAERNTMLVAAAQAIARCKWKAFRHQGEYCGKVGIACHLQQTRNPPNQLDCEGSLPITHRQEYP